MSDYEAQRLANIAANAALLASLGLDTAKTQKAPKPVRKPKAKKKRDDDAWSESETRVAPRRLVRERRQTKPFVPSHSDNEDDNYRPPARREYGDDCIPQRNAQRLGIRTEDPKQFGPIPGVAVGTWWATRMDCSTAAVHAPVVAGISGTPELGAWSIALSGGYPDDVDLGEAFTYTGSGGRNLKGTKNAPKNLRTAPQTSNQSFDHRYNAALKRSAETGKPVRVIRGFKNPGKYAPAEGYRYDGLYTVERAWLAKGLTCGLLVCRYALKRVPGQPPLRERSEDGDGENEHEDEEKVDKGLGEAEALVDQSPSPSPARNEHIDVKVRGRSGEPYVEIISRQRPPLDTSDAPCRGRPKRLDESTAKRPRKSSPAPSDEPLEATGKRPRRHTRTSVPAPGEAENSAHPPRRGRPRKTMPLPEPERPRRRAPRCSAR